MPRVILNKSQNRKLVYAYPAGSMQWKVETDPDGWLRLVVWGGVLRFVQSIDPEDSLVEEPDFVPEEGWGNVPDDADHYEMNFDKEEPWESE